MEPKLKLNKRASSEKRLKFEPSEQIRGAIEDFYNDDSEGHTLDLVAKIWDMADTPEQAMFYAYSLGGFHQHRQQVDPMLQLMASLMGGGEKPE